MSKIGVKSMGKILLSHAPESLPNAGAGKRAVRSMCGE
jgi:hypothetical protein